MLSINLNVKRIIKLFKKIFSLITNKNRNNYTDKSELIEEYIPQEKIKDLIQEDLPFIRAETNSKSNEIKFNIPSIELLKVPTKKERESSNKS